MGYCDFGFGVHLRRIKISNFGTELLRLTMSDDQAPKKSWPNDYYVGPADHLHAFGVLLTAFNSFEDGIFSLYRHHLDLLKVPFPFVETGYF